MELSGNTEQYIRHSRRSRRCRCRKTNKQGEEYKQMENKASSGIHQRRSTEAIPEQIKEKTEITITEKIQDISLDISLLDENYFETFTKKINGFLECFIIESNKKCHVKISLHEFRNIVLFEDKEFSGSRFIPILKNAFNEEGKFFSNTQSRVALNNKIHIEIRGQKNTQIKIIARYS